MKIKRDLDSAAHLVALPMPPLGARPITAVFVAALVANHRSQRAERRRRAPGPQLEEEFEFEFNPGG